MPDRDAFNRICSQLDLGVPLNLKMVGDVFGQEFWMLLVLMQTNLHVLADGNIKVEIITKE